MPPRHTEPLSREGVAYALLAYFVWGFAAIYWKWTSAFPSTEILAYRVLASMAIGWLLVVATGGLAQVRATIRSRRALGAIVAASLLIGTNWLVFIYAVQTDRILATSLGYYINPLVNVLFGLVLLGERLSRAQTIAVALAATGVAIQTAMLGTLPWISLVLAVSFGLYGLVRKTAPAEPLTGYALETLTLSPLALLFLAALSVAGDARIPQQGPMTWLLVAASGLLTAVPLLAFASAARRLPLSTLGMFQYLAPTLSFGVAVALYDEPLELGHAFSFGFVWLALAIFAWDASQAGEAAAPPDSEAQAVRSG